MIFGFYEVFLFKRTPATGSLLALDNQASSFQKDTFFRLEVYDRVKISRIRSIYMSREICDLGLFKDPKGLTDEFYECEKVPKLPGYSSLKKCTVHFNTI